MPNASPRKQAAGYFAAVSGIVAVTAIGRLLQQHFADTTAALIMLLIVLFVALEWGYFPALFASLFGVLCLYHYFLAPTGASIMDPENGLALAAFFTTAVTVGGLSAKSRRRAADAAEQRKRFLDVLDVLPAYVILLTADYHVSFANKFFRERFGESHGKRCFEYLFGRRDPCEVCETYKVLQTRSPARWEWVGPDGRDYDIFDFPFADSDGSTLILEMGLDITERKRADNEIRRINRANRALSRCNEALIRAINEATLFQRICDLIVEEAGYRLCWVGRAEHDACRSVRPIAQAGLDDGYLENLNVTWDEGEGGKGPTGTCIRTGRTVFVQHIATDPLMSRWRGEAMKRGYASNIAIPLLLGTEVFGALSIYASEPDAFVPEEIKLLAELASDLAFGIVTLRTRDERARAEAEVRSLNAGLEQRVRQRTVELHAANTELERAREREVEIAARLQQTLLLEQPPADVPGLQIAALTLPSQQIDGDFYTFFKHKDGSLDVVIGDVMGKGIPAALVGAATKSRLVDSFARLMGSSANGAPPEPKDIVTMTHARISRQLIALDSFVTLCYARLHPGRRVIELIDCGHTGTIHWHAGTGRCDVLHGNNLPLGVLEDESYSQASYSFEPGDGLVFYSDGITEARNWNAELFGVDRLQQAVTAGRELDPAALVQAIREAVAEFSGSERLRDDFTIVAVRMPAYAELEIASNLRELRTAREFVRRFCSDAPGPPLAAESVNALELAVNEAVSNVMKHAYGGRTDRYIHLDAAAFPGQVAIRLRHSGTPFDPLTAVPAVLDGSRDSGFGTYIISRSVDEVSYYRDEQGMSCISLVKNHRS